MNATTIHPHAWVEELRLDVKPTPADELLSRGPAAPWPDTALVYNLEVVYRAVEPCRHNHVPAGWHTVRTGPYYAHVLWADGYPAVLVYSDESYRRTRDAAAL